MTWESKKMKPNEKLKQLREAEQLSQAEFGKKYGLKDFNIAHMERERQKIPTKLAIQLEREYGISSSWWETGEGHMYLSEITITDEEVKARIALSGLTSDELNEIFEVYKENKEILKLLLRALKGDEEAIINLQAFLKVVLKIKKSDKLNQ
jgi:DNA-binding XRE family transcriptional regulator